MSTRSERLASEIKRNTLTGIPRALADEACLIVERLEQLDKILQGDADAWLGIQSRLGGMDIAEITINAPLAEARQQAVALGGLLDKLAKALGAEVAHVPPASRADDLAKKREDRRAQSG